MMKAVSRWRFLEGMTKSLSHRLPSPLHRSRRRLLLKGVQNPRDQPVQVNHRPRPYSRVLQEAQCNLLRLARQLALRPLQSQSRPNRLMLLPHRPRWLP